MLWLLILTMLFASLSLLTPRNAQEKPYDNRYAFCKKLDEKMKYYYNWRMGFLKFYMNIFLPAMACFAISAVYTTYMRPDGTDISFLTSFAYAVLTVVNIYTIRGIDSIAYHLNNFWLICFVALPSVDILFLSKGFLSSDNFFNLIFSTAVSAIFISTIIQLLVVALCVFLYIHKRKELFCNTKNQLKELYGETIATSKKD